MGIVIGVLVVVVTNSCLGYMFDWGISIGILGVAVAIVVPLFLYLWPHRPKSWRMILGEIDKLNSHLTERGVKFDYIVSFAGGGLVIADLLHIKYYPNIPVIAIPLVIEPPTSLKLKKVKVTLGCLCKEFFEGKSVLVIDDVVQTGLTMDAVIKFLQDGMGIEISRIYMVALGKPENVVGFSVSHVCFEYKSKTALPWGEVPRV